MLVLVIVTTLIATILSFVIKEDLRRLTYAQDNDEVAGSGKRKPSWLRKKQDQEVELPKAESPSPQEVNSSV